MSKAVLIKSKDSQIIKKRAKARITEDSILSGIIEKVFQQIVLKQLFLVYQDTISDGMVHHIIPFAQKIWEKPVFYVEPNNIHNVTRG